MRTSALSTDNGRPRAAKTGCLLAVVLLLLPAGCQDSARSWVTVDEVNAPADPESTDAEPAFRSAPLTPTTSTQPPPTQIDVRLRVLHVQVPSTARTQTAQVWNHLREDALDSRTRQRLHANGVRVGVGRIERWDTIQAILNAAEDTRVHELPPVRILPGVPLALSLDREPREQSIFYLDPDGVISGDTWPNSQKVLRTAYTLDTRAIDRVLLSVVPEIRQQLSPGLSYTPETGWASGPRRTGRAFAAAGFAVPVDSAEFVLITPGEKAGVFGMVGGVFLTDKLDDAPYDSYVFIRAEVKNVQRNR